MGFKLAIMAWGAVGRRVLEYVGQSYAGDLTAVILDKAMDWQDREFDMYVPAHAARLTWENGVARDIRLLAAQKPDVLLLAWWPHILKEPHLAIAPITLNFHPGLLPFCRGKDPNFWALKNGLPFGVTIHHVTRDVDAGPIAFERSIPYSWEDNAESLYQAAQREMFDLFVETYPLIREGKVPSHRQQISDICHKRADMHRAASISLDQPTKPRDLLNLLRAATFPPHRGCTFNDGGRIYQVRISIEEVMAQPDA